jgi:cysteine desulfurase/selenocysteine lyase
MNVAHQGPLPRMAAAAVLRAVAEKGAPHRISDEAFTERPQALRQTLARVIGADADDIILGNSASYGLDLLAHAITWRRGDEVLLVDGEYPATVFPWRSAERQGVTVRLMRAEQGAVPAPEEVARQFTEHTRVFCTSWVNSFTGYTADVRGIARECGAAGVMFVLNATQGLGARSLDVATLGLDALTCCGYKWLLGPYGTGFCWIRPDVRVTLQPPHVYWFPNVWGSGRLQRYDVRADLGARAYDVFGTADFLNVAAWSAAVEYLIGLGLDEVSTYDAALVDRLLAQLDHDLYELVSPSDLRRSTLVVLRPRRGHDAARVRQALSESGIDVAVREGALRLSPHVHNCTDDIDQVAEALIDAVA